MPHDKQETIAIGDRNALFAKAAELGGAGYRLVKISCSVMDLLQLDYTFDSEYSLVNLRITLPFENPEMASVSGMFANAFLYENEIHDLFGVKFPGLSVDFKGNFYRTKMKFPFINFLKQQAEKDAVKG